MYGKIDRYLLIALVAIGLVCLYFLFTNHKKGNDRDNLLLAMARKLGASEPDGSEQFEKQLEEKFQKVATKAAPTEEEEAGITNIADKLCFSKALTQEEAQFQKRFSYEIQEELITSRKTLGILINKFMAGASEFDQFEKDFYEANKEEIDTIVHNRKVLDSVVRKIVEGRNDFTEEELQCQQNYPQYIEQALAHIRQAAPAASQPHAAFTDQADPPADPAADPPPASGPPASMKGANPPMAADERLRIILSLFQDKIPKTVTEITELYSKATGTKPHSGNRSLDLGKLVDEGKLKCAKAGKDKKVYHGLPQWFEGNKLKPEYKPAKS